MTNLTEAPRSRWRTLPNWGPIQTGVAVALAQGVLTRIGLRPNPHSNWAFLWACLLIAGAVTAVVAHGWLLSWFNRVVRDELSPAEKLTWRLTAGLVILYDIAVGPAFVEWIVK